MNRTGTRNWNRRNRLKFSEAEEETETRTVPVVINSVETTTNPFQRGTVGTETWNRPSRPMHEP